MPGSLGQKEGSTPNGREGTWRFNDTLVRTLLQAWGDTASKAILLSPPRRTQQGMPVRHTNVDACYESLSDLKAGLGGVLMEGEKSACGLFLFHDQHPVAARCQRGPIYKLEAFAVAVALFFVA